jgi:hypothetical protein
MGGGFGFSLASAMRCLLRMPFGVFSFRWHPRFAFVFQALPLCGAAPTFLCRRKEK